MRAAVFSDGGVAWSSAEDPVPGTSEMVIEVRAAALNGADLHQMAGRYPPPAGTPMHIGGLECAGVVVGVGAAVHEFATGDKVMGLVPGAGQAEFAVLHERLALRVPDALDWPGAGGFSEVFATAHDALVAQAGLAPGEHLLVQGAAGGVGSAAVQLASALGARVTASVRDAARRGAVAALGARGILPTSAVSPEEAAAGGPYDVVLELVGGPNLNGDVELLATGGRIVVIGIGAGSHAELELRTLMGKRARISASTLRARTLEERATLTRRLERHVLPLVAAGAVRVPVEATFPFVEVAAAYRRFREGAKLGKIVLVRD